MVWGTFAVCTTNFAIFCVELLPSILSQVVLMATKGEAVALGIALNIPPFDI